MHADELDTGADVVRRLLAEQLPHLAELPLRPLTTAPGTVNAVWRLGDELAVRLPRTAAWAADLERELTWLPVLARHLPVAVPEPVHRGEPSARYPVPWAVYRWIDGEPWADDAVDEVGAARDLAAVVAALRGVDPSGAPPGGRRPLRELDAATRASIAGLADEPDLDAGAVARAWQRSLDAPAWDRRHPVWVHGDLVRPNLLVAGRRLAAVLDLGGAGAGDPAADVIAAWSVLGAPGRVAFRDALDVDDATWDRARGTALHQAVQIVPYYRRTNPGFADHARRTIRQVLADLDLGAVDGGG